MIYEPTQENIKMAATALLKGEVVAFPTETVYGLGANALDPIAVKKIFTLKGRPNNNPLIVHVSDISKINQIVDLSKNSKSSSRLKKLAHLLPGPLSVILPKSDILPDIVTAGGNTVAVRIPDHPVALKLLKESGLPIAAPSANPSGYISPTIAKHVDEILGSKISIVLDGGACQIGLESTVVSLALDKVILMRPGIITKLELEEALGEPIELNNSTILSNDNTILTSPGQLSEHYAPATMLKFIDQLSESDKNKKIGLIKFSSTVSGTKSNLIDYHYTTTLSNEGNLNEIANKLFYTLREMDKLSLDLIAIERCDEKGIGSAIMDRLRRANSINSSEPNQNNKLF